MDMLSALRKAGLVNKEKDIEYKDNLQKYMDIVKDHFASSEDINVFNSFNPASDKNIHANLPTDAKINLVQLESYRLFGYLGYDFKRNPEKGIFVSNEFSFLPLYVFNKLYNEGLKIKRPIEVSFIVNSYKSKNILKVNVVDSSVQG